MTMRRIFPLAEGIDKNKSNSYLYKCVLLKRVLILFETKYSTMKSNIRTEISISTTKLCAVGFTQWGHLTTDQQ